MTLSSGVPQAQPSAAGQLIGELAVRIAGPFAGTLPGVSPSELLRDLQAGKLLRDVMDALQARGYSLETVTVSKPLLKLKCTLSRLVGQGVTYYLIQAPRAILDDASVDNWGAFNALVYLFEKRARLFIFCESLDAPARAYRQIMDAWRDDRDIVASYIPWRDITDLMREKPDERAEILGQLLGLDGRTLSGPLKLTGDQRKQLTAALLSAFPNRGALEQMVKHGMEENLAEIAGDPNLGQAIFDLIEWADAKGRLEELIRKAYEANPGNPELADFVKQTLES